MPPGGVKYEALPTLPNLEMGSILFPNYAVSRFVRFPRDLPPIPELLQIAHDRGSEPWDAPQRSFVHSRNARKFPEWIDGKPDVPGQRLARGSPSTGIELLHQLAFAMLSH